MIGTTGVFKRAILVASFQKLSGKVRLIASSITVYLWALFSCHISLQGCCWFGDEAAAVLPEGVLALVNTSLSLIAITGALLQ